MPAAHAHSPIPWKRSPSSHLVAVDELLVAEEVAVRVHDPLREPGRARRVVELRRIVRRSCRTPTGSSRRVTRACRVAGSAAAGPTHGRSDLHSHLVGHEHRRVRVTEPMANRVVPVQDPTARAGSRRASIPRRTQPPSREAPGARPRRGRPGPPRAPRVCARPGSRDPGARPRSAPARFRRSSPKRDRASRADGDRRRLPRCSTAPGRPTGGPHGLLVSACRSLCATLLPGHRRRV